MESTLDTPTPDALIIQPTTLFLNQKHMNKLHKELKLFFVSGMLFPIRNNKLLPEDHYVNHSKVPIRQVSRPLFDRVQTLSATQKQYIFPHIYDSITIKETKRTKTPSWLGDTTTTRKKYDQWYWKMRLLRTPFNQAFKLGTNPLMTTIQKRAHEFHIEAAIQRNSHLEGPPKWLIIQSLEW
jgi:hypothetical protein